MVKIGEKAEDFCLKNQNTESICLSNFKGKWIVLYFYPKDMTAGCTKEAVDFSNSLEKFTKFNAVILGISPDTVEKHNKFIQKNDLRITLLSDETKEIIKEYGAWGIKKMYGKEYEGVIRSTFLINQDGLIEFIWTKVKVKNHIEDVLQNLEKLQNQ